MSEADSENEAVRFDRPSLDRTKVLCAACGVENEIAVTKLFGFVVSMYEELIVNDVAVEDSVTLVPAMKFVAPNGMYPNAPVMLAAVKACELKGTYPNAPVMLAAVKAAELNGV